MSATATERPWKAAAVSPVKAIKVFPAYIRDTHDKRYTTYVAYAHKYQDLKLIVAAVNSFDLAVSLAEAVLERESVLTVGPKRLLGLRALARAFQAATKGKP